MKFVIEIARGSLASNSGLVLAGKILAGLDLDAQVNGIAIPGCVSEPKITNGDVIRAYVGLLMLGRTAYEDIEIHREHGFFRRALGIRWVPSSETLRQRLDVLAGRVDEALKAVNEGILKQATLTPVRTERGAYLPLDVDVSPMDNSKTKKEGVGRTYKGMDGYAPIFAYVGAEGHMANCVPRSMSSCPARVEDRASPFAETLLARFSRLQGRGSSYFIILRHRACSGRGEQTRDET